MILYHFTKPKNVEAIQRDGLCATLTGDSLSMIGSGPPVVFLCDTPTSAITDAEVKILLRRHPGTHIASKRWLRHHSDEPLARFAILLPSSDLKLKQYERWLRANYHRMEGLPDPDDVLLKRAMTTWWDGKVEGRRTHGKCVRVYFGDIAPSKIIECTTEAAIPMEPTEEAAM
jgi:hypothetical protein